MLMPYGKNNNVIECYLLSVRRDCFTLIYRVCSARCIFSKPFVAAYLDEDSEDDDGDRGSHKEFASVNSIRQQKDKGKANGPS